MPWTALGNLDI